MSRLPIDAIFGEQVLGRDVRMTPEEPVRQLFAAFKARGRAMPLQVLDPCAGDGSILRIADEHGYQPWAVEVREEERARLEAICGKRRTTIADWREVAGALRPFAKLSETVIVTNPPYSIAREIAEACFKAEPDTIALLLRCNHLGSNPWRPFWIAHRPTAALYIKRPSFTADGKTDASEYVWVLWQEGAPPLDIDWI
jgi:hypothetical protein